MPIYLPTSNAIPVTWSTNSNVTVSTNADGSTNLAVGTTSNGILSNTTIQGGTTTMVRVRGVFSGGGTIGWCITDSTGQGYLCDVNGSSQLGIWKTTGTSVWSNGQGQSNMGASSPGGAGNSSGLLSLELGIYIVSTTSIMLIGKLNGQMIKIDDTSARDLTGTLSIGLYTQTSVTHKQYSGYVDSTTGFSSFP